MLKARPGPTIGTRRALLELAGSLGPSGFEPRTDVQDAQPKPVHLRTHVRLTYDQRMSKDRYPGGSRGKAGIETEALARL